MGGHGRVGGIAVGSAIVFLLGACSAGSGSVPPPSSTPPTVAPSVATTSPSAIASPVRAPAPAAIASPVRAAAPETPSPPYQPSSSASLPSPAPTPSPTPGQTPRPTATPGLSLHGWIEQASFPGESLDVLVPGGPGLIAVGSRASTGDADLGDARIRLSADGSTWRTAVVEGSSGGTIHAIRRVDATYVALGTRHMGGLDLRGAVWTSPDAERWTLAATLPQRFPLDIVEHDGRLLAVGTTLWWSDSGGFFAWSPDDLGRWGPAREVHAPDWFRDGFVAEGVITTSRGYLAFGNVGGVIPALANHIWVASSTDGLTWRFARDQPSLQRAAFKAVVERRDGYLAVGWALTKDGSPAPAVWHSADGMTWKRTVDPAASTTGWLARAAISDDRLLVRGASDGGEDWRAVSWESLDGIHWTLLPLGADIPDVTGTMPSDPVTLRGRRFAVATLQGPPLTRAVVLAQGQPTVAGGPATLRSPSDEVIVSRRGV